MGALVAAGALVLALVVFGAPGKHGPTDLPFQAGYVSCCAANVVSASWRTPTIAHGVGFGEEAAWVGVQTGTTFFLQAGTIEEQDGVGDDYFAFWSDTERQFLPQYFPDMVHPGDLVHAQLRRTATQWVVTFRDVTGRWTDTASIPSTGVPAVSGEWLDEDLVVVNGVLPTTLRQVTAMPPTSPLVFQSVELNGAFPSDIVAASFEDASHRHFVPHWLAPARFEVVPTP